MRLVRVIWNNASEQLKKITSLSLQIKKFHFSKSSYNSTIMSYVPPVLTSFQNTENVVKNKMVNLKQWHEEFTGLDEVRAAQNRVLEVKY
jgi:conjugal transfer/entry exclusion protein